jgi:hypothetical protein
MKKLLFASLLCLLISGITLSQGNEKNKGKKSKASAGQKNNMGDGATNHDNIIWEGTKDSDGGRPKPSKNQPAKVRAAFSRDYPNAVNVQWSKYRGDWTARFTHGPFLSTAVYHANGDRRDTRTSILRPQIPPVIIEAIFKKFPGVEIGVGVKIEVPRAVKDIFRIKTVTGGTTKFLFYNSDGTEERYAY